MKLWTRGIPHIYGNTWLERTVGILFTKCSNSLLKDAYTLRHRIIKLNKKIFSPIYFHFLCLRKPLNFCFIFSWVKLIILILAYKTSERSRRQKRVGRNLREKYLKQMSSKKPMHYLHRKYEV